MAKLATTTTTNKTQAVAKRPSISPLADAGRGTENVTSADLIIPRLTLVHEMSRVTKKTRPEFIKGAKPGMFCLASIQKLYEGEETGILVIPCYFTRRWVEWIPRDQGGGIVGSHDSKDVTNGLEKVSQAKWVTEDGHEIIETPEHYFMIVDEESGEYERVVFSMTGTKATHSRRWLTLISNQKIRDEGGNTFVAPSFMNIYRMKSSPQSNDQGDFHVPIISLESELINVNGEEVFDGGAELYKVARSFHELTAQGRVAASEEEDADLATDEDEAKEPKTRRKTAF
jgi:hypothetical protein